MKVDRNKVVNLFSLPTDFLNPHKTQPAQQARPTRKTPPKEAKSKGVANSLNRERMMSKLEDGAYDEFNEKDWFHYFVLKAEEQGIKYLVRNYAKDYTIIKSILNELSWVELKDMIDFLWESNQDIVEKPTMGVWILSKGWINTVYQNSLLWKEGKYVPKSAPSRNREWVAAEASAKPVRESRGLKYGKPIKEQTKVVDSPTSSIPKKRKITLGRKR